MQVLLALSAVAFLLCGCREEVVRPLKTVEDVRPTETPTPRKTSLVRSTPQRSAHSPGWAGASSTRSTPVPTPALTPMTIHVSTMFADNGSTDSEGGYQLVANGALYRDHLRLDFTAHGVTLEMKGDPSGNIWPEIDLNMYNRTEKKSFFPWPRDYVTTDVYHEFHRELDRPLPPGEYLVTFRYYNNAGWEVKDDRNVFLRKVVLYP